MTSPRAPGSGQQVINFDKVLELYMQDDLILNADTKPEEGQRNGEASATCQGHLENRNGEDQAGSIESISELTDGEMPALTLIPGPSKPEQAPI